MKRGLALLAVVFIAAVAVVQWGEFGAQADPVGDEELSMYMAQLQRHAHKLGLSIDAKNGDLAAFYLTEINELVPLIAKKFPQYDGVQVGALIGAMLTPYTKPLDDALKAGDWAQTGAAFDKMITGGCNGCHTATQHGFIKITRSKSNPFGQDFSK
jgi:hypothetical protein